MSNATIRQQVENVAYNFSDTQVKVREATSNEGPWEPNADLLIEIINLSNNPSAFTEIMSIIWKRLNDHGKNWRQVYKSLVLLDVMVMYGSEEAGEKCVAECHRHIDSIERLRDFPDVLVNGTNEGINVREKAGQTAALLRDEENLTTERRNNIYDQQRMRNGFVSTGTAAEDYQLALEESRKEAERLSTQPNNTVSGSTLSQSALDDLLSLGLGQMIVAEPQPVQSNPAPSTQAPPTLYPSVPTPTANDPWSAPTAPAASVDPFSAWDAPAQNVQLNNVNSDPFASLSLAHAPVNPFTANQRKSPTLNEMRAGSTPTIPPTGARTLLPQPLQPDTIDARLRRCATAEERQREVAQLVKEAQLKHAEKEEKKQEKKKEKEGQTETDDGPARRTRQKRPATSPAPSSRGSE